VSDRINQLQSLLERVKRNAAAPRGRRMAPPPPPPISDTMVRSFERAPAPEPEDDVPMPLVRVASTPMASPAPAPAPPPFVDAPTPTPFSMTSEVATVEFAESVPPEPVAEADVEDLSSDLLESLPPPAETAWAGAVATSTELIVEEEPPISSQRPRLVSGLEDTLSDSGTDAPLMTPPPESGPQEAPSPPPQGLFAPSLPNVDSLLDDSAGPISRAAPGEGPSPEQIGESVELDEQEGPSIELAEAATTTVSVPPNEELEATLDAPPSAGIYDEALMPPPGARDELEAHDRRFSPSGMPAASADATSSLPAEASLRPAFPNEAHAAPYVPPSTAEASGFAAPEVFSPAMPSGGAPEFRMPAPSFQPQSFLELLDASIALRG
jgi:hypothetical protein